VGIVERDSADGNEAEGKPNERHKLLYKLAVGGKDMQHMVDASRIGEFEALKALNDLIEWGYLKAIPPPRGAKAIAEGLKKGRKALAKTAALARLALSLGFFVATLLLVKFVAPQLGSSRAENPARRGAVATEALQVRGARAETAVQIEARHGPAGALPLAVGARDHHDRPVVALDEPRGHDADHAFVPSLPRDDIRAPPPVRLGP